VDEEALIARLNMVAAEMRREDDLIGQRMSWLVMSQSFLLGTFVALVGLKGAEGQAAAAVGFLLVLVPLVGALLPALVLLAMGAALYAMSQWRDEYDRILQTPQGAQLGWPRLKHQSLVRMLGQSLPIVVSGGFLLTWLAVLIRIGLV
jgi:hypothetical protein